MKKTLLSVMLTAISIITSATTFTVTNTNDAGSGSLRDQIAAASGGDTILFDASLNNSTITLTTGEISIAKSLTIIGLGRNSLTISGNSNARIFRITGGDVTIRDLKIEDGNQTDMFDNDGGAILHTTSGNLTLSNVFFTNNSSVNNNGSQAGAVGYFAQNGFLSIDSCIFISNTATSYGGAICLNQNSASGSISNTIIVQNTTTYGCGAVLLNADTVVVSNTSIVSNTGNSNVIDVSSCNETTFINVTISGNTNPNNTHIIQMPKDGTMKMINCTYKDNNAPIRVVYDDDPITFIFQNSIFDNSGDNFDIEYNPDITFISLGGNISNDTTGKGFLTSTNDTTDIDPMLGSLEEGGFHKPLCGSIAINNGIANGAPTTDQRGMARYKEHDAGSYELQPSYGTDTKVACREFKWINGVTYTASNSVAKDTIAGIASCDSIVTLNLTVNNVSSVTTTVTDSLTITADNANGTYQWLDCNNGMSVITDSTNQSINPQGSGNYAVEITENGCKDTSDCVNFIRSSILKNTFSTSLSVYPNPSAGSFAISFDNIQDEITIELVTVSGQMLENKIYSNTNHISLEVNQPNGVYLLKVKDNKGNVAIIKLIKN